MENAQVVVVGKYDSEIFVWNYSIYFLTCDQSEPIKSLVAKNYDTEV
jgi:hypothetical protein